MAKLRYTILQLPNRIGMLILCLLLASCASYRAKRINKHIQKLKEQGLQVKRDTTWQTIEFKGPSITNTLEVKFPKTLRDTVVMTRDSIQVKWFPKIVKEDTVVYVEIKCPETDMKGKVPVAIEESVQVHTGIKWWWVLIALIFGTAAGAYLVWKRVVIHTNS